MLKRMEIEAIVIIGGDGTLQGANCLAKESNLAVIGVPSTIDNDVYGTDFTIGFDTAVNTAVEAIDRIRDTARSHERLFFVEVMGRTRGFIALESGIAAGAEDIIVPEIPEDINSLCESLQRKFSTGKKSAIVTVAEAGEPGSTFRIAREVKKRLGVEPRVCVLGHIQRGGSPTVRDRILASKFGSVAVEALVAGEKGQMVGEVRGQIVKTPLSEIQGMRKELNIDLINLMKVLAR
jgi:6-phosphofructokinase 1